MMSWEDEQAYEIQRKQQFKAIEKLAEALKDLTEAGLPIWIRNSEEREAEVRFDVSFTFHKNGEFAAYRTSAGERSPEKPIFRLAVDEGELLGIALKQMKRSENEG